MRTSAGLALVLVSMLALVCSPSAKAQGTSSPSVVDMHVDLAYALHYKGKGIGDAARETSMGRLKKGNVSTLVLPLFVPNAYKKKPQEVRDAYEASYNTLMAALRSRAAQGQMTPPLAPQNGQVATVLAFEGADGFSDDPLKIVPWIEKGACLVGVVHFNTNALAGSSTEPAAAKRSTGLTDFGKVLVRTVYSNGAIVDLAHASDTTMDDVALIAQDFGAPLISTHSGARALKPIDRNVSDRHMQAIAASGGVVGLDLHAGHIGSQNGAGCTLDDFIAHLEHAVKVAGAQHVAIGSDFEGGIEPPSDSDGEATWPRLTTKLRAKGWSDANIEAVYGGNARRVLKWATDRGCGKAVAAPPPSVQPTP